jgi:hypothetical protein
MLEFCLESIKPSRQNTALHFEYTEAAIGLQTPRQTFERILFLQDNSASHKAAISHKKFGYLYFEVLEHQVCSLDLAPSNYYPFPYLKKQLNGRNGRTFFSIVKATSAAEGLFSAQQK